jgi:hypothetical protein
MLENAERFTNEHRDLELDHDGVLQPDQESSPMFVFWIFESLPSGLSRSAAHSTMVFVQPDQEVSPMFVFWIFESLPSDAAPPA